MHHPENLVREASMPTGAAEPPRSVHDPRLSSAPCSGHREDGSAGGPLLVLRALHLHAVPRRVRAPQKRFHRIVKPHDARARAYWWEIARLHRDRKVSACRAADGCVACGGHRRFLNLRSLVEKTPDADT